VHNLWVKKVRPLPKKKPLQPVYIRQWRTFRDLSLEQVAERVAEDLEGREDFSHASLSRIERGEQPYTQRTLEAIARALNCEPADLLMRNPQDKDAPWSIFDQLKKADKATRVRIAAVVEALAKTGS